jgi:PAS domain-containing protein
VVIWADLQDFAIFAAAAFGSAIAAQLLFASLDLRGRINRRSILTQGDHRTVFLFDDDMLVDATEAARLFLDAAPRGTSDLTRLMSLLAPRFPDIARVLEALPETGTIHRDAGHGGLNLIAEMRGTLVRLTLIDPDGPEASPRIDRHSFDAMERELETLRGIARQTPLLIWRQDASGRITWVNQAYVEIAERLLGPDATAIWPLPALFDTAGLVSVGTATHRRLPLPRVSDETAWYECHAAPIGEETLFTAVDANVTVRAEMKLREFMQTLTQTFSHLTVGLGVFDRARRLVVFNPALSDLTGLPVDFLTAKPTLFGFLDTLRERRMIPEPKDYGSWRRRIVELEAAAAEGSYAEVWSLPDGRTYRVSGRPQPDGAIAFLFEDISAEISLTRRFRSELEVGQGVLDAIEDAIAVFSAGGILVVTNGAYGELWGEDPDTSLTDIDVLQATRRWMALTAPTPVWGDLRDFVTRNHDRSDWVADVRLRDGRALICRVVPIASGATMVRFQPGAQAARPPLPLTRQA